jgi:phosphohistidine phosphatase
MDSDLMLVGHLPHLSKLASLLLTGSPDQSPVTFTRAGIICLQKDDSAHWTVAWSVTPEDM